MKYRKLGETKLKVSEIGFGGWPIGGNKYGRSCGLTNDKVSLLAIKKSFELGCNFFDTSDSYGFGHSEELLGEALKDWREEVLIATKAGNETYPSIKPEFNYEYLNFALDKSLKRLKTDYVDLFQLHDPPIDVLSDELLQVLEKFQDEGKICYFGLATPSPSKCLVAIRKFPFFTAQVTYNIFCQQTKNILDFCQSKNIGVIVIKPLARGLLTGKYNYHSRFVEGDIRKKIPEDVFKEIIKRVYEIQNIFSNSKLSLTQLALKFILNEKSVSTVIPGIKTLKQAKENMKVSEISDLSNNDLNILKNFSKFDFCSYL